MKDKFIGYRKKTEEEIKAIWETGIICFDTNVLLNLYRYSDSTREIILTLIEKLENKVFIPYQVALEYNRNRFEIISEQEQVYKDFVSKISLIQNELQTPNKPPFLSSNIQAKLNSVIEEVSKELEATKLKYNDYLKLDPIFDKICLLFENKVGENYTNEQINEVFKQGEERFKIKTPPGYEDEKEKEGNRKYGDLVLWLQIIDLAKEKNKPILLVTDERKKDWWWKMKDGRTIGPRQELITEMKQKANVDFHMYSSERFVSFGMEFFKENINEEAVQEIVELKNSDLELQKHKSYLKNKLTRLQHDIRVGESALNKKDQILDELNKHRDDLYLRGKDSPELQEYAHNLGYSEAEHIEEKEQLIERLDHLKKMRKTLFNEFLRIQRKQ